MGELNKKVLRILETWNRLTGQKKQDLCNDYRSATGDNGPLEWLRDLCQEIEDKSNPSAKDIARWRELSDKKWKLILEAKKMISQGTINRLRDAKIGDVVVTEAGNVVIRESLKGIDSCALCAFCDYTYGQCNLVPCCGFERPDETVVYFERVAE